MANTELSMQWLKKADDDYVSAEVLLENTNPPQIETACYHKNY